MGCHMMQCLGWVNSRMLVDPENAPRFPSYHAIDVQVMTGLEVAYGPLCFRPERAVHLHAERFLQANDGIRGGRAFAAPGCRAVRSGGRRNRCGRGEV